MFNKKQSGFYEHKIVPFYEEKYKKVLISRMDTIISDIRQHDQAWHTRSGVGGSGVAIITGDNPYKTKEDYMREKMGLTSDAPNPLYTEWGNIFEEVIKRYTESIFNTEVLYSESFIRHSDHIYYSPDGVGIMKKGKDIVETLFEFKAPFSRKLKEVPKYYVPQVMLGMEVLNVDSAFYLECVFRCCEISDLKFGNLNFNKELGQHRCGGDVKAIGVVGFKMVGKFPPKFIERCKEEFGESPDESLLDFGGCSKELFLLVVDLLKNKQITTTYTDIIFDNIGYESLLNMEVERVHKGCFGVLPWKMFDVKGKTFQRDRGFLNKWEGQIIDFCKAVDKCKGKEDSEKRLVLYEFFRGGLDGN